MNKHTHLTLAEVIHYILLSTYHAAGIEGHVWTEVSSTNHPLLPSLPLHLQRQLLSYPLWHVLLRHWVCDSQHVLADWFTWSPAPPPRIKPFKEEATLIRVVACTTNNHLPHLRPRGS